MPLYVQNRLSTSHLLTLMDGKAVAWKPLGDADGEDVVAVPETYGDDIGFQTAVRRGHLKVLTEEEAYPSVVAQDNASRSEHTTHQAETESHLYRVADKTLSAAKCVGPARGGKPCGEPVVQRKNDVGVKPPLCDRHKSLEAEYVPVEGDVRNEETGKVETTWQRVSLKR